MKHRIYRTIDCHVVEQAKEMNELKHLLVWKKNKPERKTKRRSLANGLLQLKSSLTRQKQQLSRQ